MSNRKSEQKIVLELPAGERLDKFLAQYLSDASVDISRSQLQRLIGDGHVSGIAPHLLKSSYKAKAAHSITIMIPAEKPAALIPFEASIPVLYQDEYLAIVHKPAGMTVHPGAATGADTLVHALVGQMDKLAPHAERPGIVHRLDRETEGLMVIAKTDQARAALGQLFAERQVNKVYQAIVWGNVQLPDEIDGYIWRDRRDRKKMRFGERAPESPARAREAQLMVTQSQNFKNGTELEIQLITGRTHQIRATCAHLHAPIVGDALYGDDAGRGKTYKVNREKREALATCGMLLMARRIAFSHPLRRKKIDIELDLPQRFEAARRLLS